MDWTFNDFYYDYNLHPDNADSKSLADFFENIHRLSVVYQFAFSCIGFLINILHLIIITRKSLRINSVYVIMIGITMSDLYIMFHVIYAFLDNVISNYNWYGCTRLCNANGCRLPKKLVIFIDYQYHGYFHTVTELSMSALQECLRRLSTWLAFCMALFRWLIIRNSMNAKFDFLSKPTFALKTIVTIFIVSCIITVSNYMQFRIEESSDVHVKGCLKIGDYIVRNNYKIGKGMIFDDFWPIAVQISFLSDGISKVIPAVCLPFLCVGLIFCLQTAHKSRKNLSSNTANNDKTIYMVTVMTIMSVFAEGPSGISYLFEAVYYDRGSIKAALQTLDKLLINLAILNAIVHVMISLVVSTQYRETAKKLLGCSRFSRKVVVAKNSQNTVEIVSPALQGTFTSVG